MVDFQNEFEIKAAAVAASNLANGLPALQGTPRQIAFSEILRADAFRIHSTPCSTPAPERGSRRRAVPTLADLEAKRAMRLESLRGCTDARGI